jgi:hypothetical protein
VGDLPASKYMNICICVCMYVYMPRGIHDYYLPISIYLYSSISCVSPMVKKDTVCPVRKRGDESSLVRITSELVKGRVY